MVDLFDLLDREWERLKHDRAAAARLPEACRRAGDVRTLADLEQYVRRAAPADADRVLLALVSRAVKADALASRVLLQMLLPGTKRLAARWWALGDGDERAAAAVTAVYQRIRRYPLERRPGRVAANVLMDAATELRRAVPKGRPILSADPAAERSGSQSLDDEPADPGVGLHPSVELTEVLVEAVHDGVIGTVDAEVIARTRIAGDRIADLEGCWGLRARTLWDRRKRAEGALVGAHARSRLTA